MGHHNDPSAPRRGTWQDFCCPEVNVRPSKVPPRAHFRGRRGSTDERTLTFPTEPRCPLALTTMHVVIRVVSDTKHSTERCERDSAYSRVTLSGSSGFRLSLPTEGNATAAEFQWIGLPLSSNFNAGNRDASTTSAGSSTSDMHLHEPQVRAHLEL